MILLTAQQETVTPIVDTHAVHQLFEEKAESCPSAIALRFQSQALSYKELNQAANRFANFLISCGISEGAVVGVCIDRSIELLPILLGIVKAGGAYLPLDPAFPPERLHYIAEDADAAFLVTQTDYENLLPVATPTFNVHRDWSTLARFSDQNPALPLAADSLVYLIYTSGSTGRPKGVKVTHFNLINLLLSMAKKPGLTSEDRFLALTTISFDMHVPEIFLPLCVGACICLVPRTTAVDAFKLMDALEQFSVNTMQATPATWRMLINAGWQGNNGFKVLIGGEALPKDLLAPLLQRCGELWNMYGPTETTVWSTCHRICSADDVISIGKPIDNTQVYIANEQGALVGDGEEGEICIAGHGVTLGYHKRPDLNAEKFITNTFDSKSGGTLYRSGDLGRYGDDGNIVHLGRIDSQIKVRGHRVEPGEIESALCKHSNIEQAVVDLVDVEGSGPRLVAFYISSHSPKDGLGAGDLRAHCIQNLPHYMVPQNFVAVEKFPLTPSGKIDRRALKLEYKASSNVQPTTDDLPESDLEKALLVVWRRVLSNSSINVDDSFVEAGGESILAFELVLEMRRATGIQFSYETLFENPTVRQLARSVSTKKLANPYNVVPLQAKGEKSPLYCLCGVSLYQELANNLGEERPTFGIYAPKEIEFISKTIAGEKTKISVEMLAERYCEAILQQKSDAPVQLLGFSFGGVLAVETARLLRLQNREVSVVILVDSYLPHAIINNRMKQCKLVYDRLKEPVMAGVQSITSHIHNAFSGRPRTGLEKTDRSKRASRTQSARIRRNKSYDSSTGAYVASGHRYDGEVVLIKALNTEVLDYKDLAPDYGWSRILVRPPHIHQIEGKHTDLTRGDYSRKTASIVEQYLH